MSHKSVHIGLELSNGGTVWKVVEETPTPNTFIVRCALTKQLREMSIFPKSDLENLEKNEVCVRRIKI